MLAAAVSGLLPAAAAAGAAGRGAGAARRVVRPRRVVAVADPDGRRCRTPRAAGVTLLALGAVWVALVLPHDPGDLARLPVEASCWSSPSPCSPGGAPGRSRPPCSGSALAVVVVVEAFDAGFEHVPGPALRPAHRLGLPRPGRRGARRLDRRRRGPRDRRRWPPSLVVALLVLLPLATVRAAGDDRPAPSAGARQPRRRARRGTARAGRRRPAPPGSRTTRSSRCAPTSPTGRRSRREIAADPYADAPPRPAAPGPARQGRAAWSSSSPTAGSPLQGTSFAPGVEAVVDDGTRRLDGRGLVEPAAPSSPRRPSAPASWLAHSTLQSGLWVDSQRRYDQLLGARPAHADLGVRGCRLAHGLRRTGRHAGLAGGPGFYGFDQLLRLAQRRLPRPASSGTRRCRTSTRSRGSSSSSSTRATGRR